MHAQWTNAQRLVSLIGAIFITSQFCDAYHLSLHALEWSNASIWCQSYCGSHLASIHSESQFQAMLDLIDRQYPYVYTRTWVGLNDIARSDQWVWSDGSLFDYGNNKDVRGRVIPGIHPWRSNEPDFNKSTDQAVAIEVGSQYETASSRKWVDRRPASNYQFFCGSCSSRLHKYAVINGDRNYSNAQQVCEETFGTSLASIHSNDDMLEARLTCKQVSNSNGCWLGLNDKLVSRQYQWVDGTAWDYGTVFHTYPWYLSEPGTGLDQQCIFLDPDNGADPGEYLWDDFWCDRKAPKALCNAPSEICRDQQWIIPYGNAADWVFTKRPCQVSKMVMETESVAIIGHKQFLNTAGTLHVDMMFTAHAAGLHGSTGLVFYLDESNCHNWIYAGVWVDYQVAFIGKSENGVWSLLGYQDTGSYFQKGTFYSLIVQVTGGSTWTLKWNNNELLTVQEPSNAGNTLSGYIGIRNVNTTFSIKSLFVSGEPQYFDNNPWYQACTAAPTLSPTLPTLQPSPLPTESPTTPSRSPTAAPSGSPTPSPTNNPTLEPTYTPTGDPTVNPTREPTDAPTADTESPTVSPTDEPTTDPTRSPTAEPSESPTPSPTEVPTSSPTITPTLDPTNNPTYNPTYIPTNMPTADPTMEPSANPSLVPTVSPSDPPTESPTFAPSQQPTTPTNAPTNEPTERLRGIKLPPHANAAATTNGDRANTSLIWIVGIPISLVLMCGFAVYLGRLWYDEHKSMPDGRKKSDHVRSPSNSLQEVDANDVIVIDDDTMEVGAAVANQDGADVDDIVLETAPERPVVPGDDEEAVVAVTIPADTSHLVLGNHTSMTLDGEDSNGDDADEEDSLIKDNEEKQGTMDETGHNEEAQKQLEEVIMAPDKNGKMVVVAETPAPQSDGDEEEDDDDQQVNKNYRFRKYA